jgi:hypothetical protein
MNSPAIDVLTGLIFVYFVFSMLCSGINESIARALGKRAAMLASQLARILESPDHAIVKRFYANPLVQAVFEPGKEPATDEAPKFTTASKARTHPSYLSAHTFAVAVLDSLSPQLGKPSAVDEVASYVQALPPASPLRGALLPLVSQAGTDLDQVRKNIERWYDATMDRVSGWYKRWSKRVLIVLAILITPAFNIDSVAIARVLWHNPTVRAAVVQLADSELTTTTTAATRGAAALPASAGATTTTIPSGLDEATKRVTDIKKLRLPLGWTRQADDVRVPRNFGGWVLKALGWIITAGALTLGAPFWFDMLGRVAPLRNTGPKPKPASTE